MIRSQQMSNKERGHSEEVAEIDAGFDVRQLCVRKHEAGTVNVVLKLTRSCGRSRRT